MFIYYTTQQYSWKGAVSFYRYRGTQYCVFVAGIRTRLKINNKKNCDGKNVVMFSDSLIISRQNFIYCCGLFFFLSPFSFPNFSVGIDFHDFPLISSSTLIFPHRISVRVQYLSSLLGEFHILLWTYFFLSFFIRHSQSLVLVSISMTLL